jgi:hypothetical protein
LSLLKLSVKTDIAVREQPAMNGYRGATILAARHRGSLSDNAYQQIKGKLSIDMTELQKS